MAANNINQTRLKQCYSITDLRQLQLPEFKLEKGGLLTDLSIDYLEAGNPNGPAILIQGGISADLNLIDTASSKGWWGNLVGESKTIDLSRFKVISINYLAPDEDVIITSLDQARAIKLVLDELGISRIDTFIGSSYGGMIGQAFACEYPKTLSKLISICAAGEQDSESIASRVIQRKILNSVEDETLALELARAVAISGYRGKQELANRFSNQPTIIDQDARFDVENYLEHNCHKFSQRFDVNRYKKLSLSIDLHQADLTKIEASCLFIGFDSDQIVSTNSVIKSCNLVNKSKVEIIQTPFGHDAFLIEHKKLSNHIISFLRG